MTHDYKEGPYSTGTLIERLEQMCGRGEDRGVLLGRDVWPDDVLEAIERIKQLEAALKFLIRCEEVTEAAAKVAGEPYVNKGLDFARMLLWMEKKDE